MKIGRLEADFGNSTNNFLVDGYYFELTTSVAEISKQDAERMFVSPITEKKELLDRIMISTGEGENEKFYLVGKFAEGHEIKSHVNTMNDKIHSIIPYASFLAAISYYNTIKAEDTDNEVEIDSMMMMLPIWLLKRAEKFSIAQNEMANRFIGEHKVKVLTMGMEKEIKIKVKNSQCKIEGEVARFALKYRMVQEESNTIKIEKRKEIEMFQNFETVLCDVGGGSTDCVLLVKGLTAPKERDSFKVIDIEPFLGKLETFRKEKLLQYFSNVKELESFIVRNYSKQKYILEDLNTGKTYDFTKQIVEMLQEYANKLITQIFSAFRKKDRVVKFIYFGGETPILKPYMKNSLLNIITEKALEENHLFLDELFNDENSEIFKPTPRTINLASLEILSVNQLGRKNEQQ
ncbi:Alp7A family actin-like protein [Clostridium guangxiense]|uniref:Alp7A family actin-like protein n=1 Tax=Clostridium guangxiense TaxID=1662055 RepID=UPI001E5A6022|nr:hypothetical protein [Clostridium guangxiense]MCD2345096.1 hypothetical protein [Clostridium guangxiense]